LKLRYADFTTLTRSLTLPAPVAFTEEIHSAALSLLQKIPWGGQRIRLLGVAVSKLSDKASAGQVPLFPLNPRREKAAQAVDEIRRRYGEGGITRASLLSERSRKEVG
jgi:DNA polymerase-4